MNKYIYSNKLAKLKGKRFFKMKNLELASHIVKAQSIKWKEIYIVIPLKVMDQNLHFLFKLNANIIAKIFQISSKYNSL